MSTGDEQDSQQSDMDVGPEPIPTEPYMQSFKVDFDPNLDYQGIAESMFIPGKILVVAEKLTSNAHVHFHGYTQDAERTFKNKRQKIADMHYKRNPKSPGFNPKARPVSAANRPASETGFQYLCKELPSTRAPLFSTGFTPEELATLHEQSQAHVKTIKESLQEFLLELVIPPEHRASVKTLKAFVAQAAITDYYSKQDRKYNSRFFYNDVVNAMMKRDDIPLAIRAGLLI